jgi:hypothetical protein
MSIESAFAEIARVWAVTYARTQWRRGNTERAIELLGAAVEVFENRGKHNDAMMAKIVRGMIEEEEEEANYVF